VQVLVLASITSVQIGAAWATTIFHRVGPDGACALRLVSATVAMSVFARPALGSLNRQQLRAAAALGVVLAAMNLAFYEAISRIPLGTAVTIEFLGPLLVAVAGSRRARDLVWAALAAGGIIALAHGLTHGANTEGFILAATAGLLWGGYILLQSRLGDAFEDSSGLTLAMVVAAAAVLPVGVAAASTRLLVPGTLAVGAAVGLLSSAIPYSLELKALRTLSTATFGVFMSLEPAVAAISGAILLGQAVSLRDALGIGLVSAASLGASLTSNSATGANEPINLGA
jgi:inner membrane transporter RhtA